MNIASFASGNRRSFGLVAGDRIVDLAQRTIVRILQTVSGVWS